MLSATDGNHGVDELEGAGNGKDGAGLTGEAGSADLRVKTTLNTPEGSKSTGVNLVVQTLRESNVSSTENIPQTREAHFVMVYSVFSFHRGEGFGHFGNSELHVCALMLRKKMFVCPNTDIVATPPFLNVLC